MKHTAKIVLVLLAIALVGNLPLFAGNDDYGVTVVPFAEMMSPSPEPAPVDLPPWLPTPEVDGKVLNLSTSSEIGNVAVGNVNATAASMNLGSSTAPAIPGGRAGSFMSEQRLAERSLRGTIKRLG